MHSGKKALNHDLYTMRNSSCRDYGHGSRSRKVKLPLRRSNNADPDHDCHMSLGPSKTVADTTCLLITTSIHVSPADQPSRQHDDAKSHCRYSRLGRCLQKKQKNVQPAIDFLLACCSGQRVLCQHDHVPVRRDPRGVRSPRA